MFHILLNIISIYFLSSGVLGDDVEYYPSQSVLRNKIKQNNLDYRTMDLKFIKTYNLVSPKLMRVLNEKESANITKYKRAVDPVFHGHPKTREELWEEHFLNKSTSFDQTPSLIKLINNLTLTYLNDCTPVILYDKYVETEEGFLLQNLFKIFPTSYLHGRINDDDGLDESRMLAPLEQCLHFIVFLAEVKRVANVIGLQATSKVIVVARSSQWAVHEFLSGKHSRSFVNLLVIGQTFKDDDNTLEAPYILYTHKLYIDGLGTSKPVVLTSWTHGKYSRNINLFPSKMIQGYAGHRFTIAAAHQPPFIFRRIITDNDGGNPRVVWDGVEMRVLKLLSEKNNFSIEIIEPKELMSLGSGDAVAKEVFLGHADIGVAGMYLTKERIEGLDMSFSHSQDCAVFITLMSTALPRYRAILGPFHWHVWVALTFTYLVAIFPLAFSDKHSLRHLLHNSGEVENMFWYVFGTFTNCFTFVGKNSWSRTTKITTRLLIGWYWIFTIIITSCYTGSIIAFVTLPIFPETVDTLDQLIKGFYRVGTLNKGGWERWFFNSSDAKTNKLLRKVELLPDVVSGIKNTTKAFFWPYAFLSSQAELEYIVQSNFSTTMSKRAMLHISDECFVSFGVSIAFPNQSLYTTKFNNDIRRMFQSGLMDKITDEVRWEMQRSSTGRLLSAGEGSLKAFSPEEKGLTLDDTQGMFLLLAIGFLFAAAALITEWMGSCSRLCSSLNIFKRFPRRTTSRNTLIATPISGSEEIKVLNDDTLENESRIFFDSRTTSGKSNDTLEGETINVTEQNIIVHENLDANDWDSRRSSSVELDREVQEIFEKDRRRLRGHSISVVDIVECSESENFGEHM